MIGRPVDASPVTTPLTARHEAAGARLADFAGWSMPLWFAGGVAEHTAVRTHAGVFDVSHLGTVEVVGPAAREVVAATFTGDPSTLRDGDAQYTLCCDDGGGIVDDLLVYRLAADRLLTVPNAANTAAVVRALEEAATGRDAEVVDRSRERAVLAIQGPDSLELADRCLADLGAPPAVATSTPRNRVREVEVDDGTPALICRTGYTGERGIEVVLGWATALRLWEGLVAAGAAPCGLAARDTLRLEMGYPLHGNELSTSTLPGEARLGWAVALDRGPFRGQEALRAAAAAGAARRLWGLAAGGRRPLRAGLEVRAEDGGRLGVTTSGSLSPTLGVPIALAYLASSTGPGDRVVVDVRGRAVPAEVVRPPFLQRDPAA
ncbi:MAG: glycine cleavage system aminomethyltransferase GcvT [Nitriliruptoraceae bacterium]